MTRIIIAAPSYNPAIGGSIVLHKVCHILNEIGYDAALTTTPKLNGPSPYFALHPEYNTKIATEISSEDDIIIYPEIESGNPYQCKNVVRYLLNKYHLPEHGNTMATWGENDYWLYFHNLFYDKIKEPNFLHILDTKAEVFEDRKQERVNEACFTFRKKSQDLENLNIIHPEGSIEIGYNVQEEDLIRIFNSCKRFYSYDTETYLSVLAALCGCESIVVPYRDVTKAQVLEKQPAFKYGIAYGLEDLEYANATSPKLKDYLLGLESQQIIDTKEAFTKILKHFNLT
tara:strand:- start:456 stop:1313 length:858 start_codon:yes stop_codon:yes gene_type:complete